MQGADFLTPLATHRDLDDANSTENPFALVRSTCHGSGSFLLFETAGGPPATQPLASLQASMARLRTSAPYSRARSELALPSRPRL